MSNERTAIFITVRTRSTRLPGKALLPLLGKPATRFLIEHLKSSRLAEKIILCTTPRPEDTELIELAEKTGIAHFRGSEPDKLARWLGAAKEHGVDFFVTADGDDLLADPGLIDQAIALHQSSGCDFIHSEGFPCGAFTYGIATRALEKVCQIKDTEDTEMMWGYFLDTGLFHVEKMTAPPELRRPDIRMTLDYPEDLAFFKAVLESLPGKQPLTLLDIVKFLDAHPDIVKLNQFRQAEFLDNQKRRTKIILKAS